MEINPFAPCLLHQGPRFFMMKKLLALILLTATTAFAQTPPEVPLYQTDSKEDRVALAILRALIMPEVANNELTVVWKTPDLPQDLSRLHQAARGAAFRAQKYGVGTKQTWLDLKYMSTGDFQAIVTKMKDPSNHDTIFPDDTTSSGEDYVYWRATQRGRDSLLITMPEKNFQDYLLGWLRYNETTLNGDSHVWGANFMAGDFKNDSLYVGYLLTRLVNDGLISISGNSSKAWTADDTRHITLTRAGMAHVLRGNVGWYDWGAFDYKGNWDSKWVNTKVPVVGKIAQSMWEVPGTFHSSYDIVAAAVGNGNITFAQSSSAFVQMVFLQSAGLLVKLDGEWVLTANGQKFGKAVSEGNATY